MPNNAPSSAEPADSRDKPVAGRRVRVEGRIVRILFQHKERGFSIFTVRTAGRTGTVTVKGHGIAVAPGQPVECSGKWIHHDKFGWQIAADVIDRATPKTVEGIRRFLCSDRMKGIGAKTADLLIGQFGTKLGEVIEKTPEKIFAVKGLPKARAELIIEGWKEQHELRDTIIALETFGITPAQAMKIWNTFGKRAKRIVKANPYELMRIDGIGFRTADEIAVKAGLPPDSAFRLKAGLVAVLDAAAVDGSSCLPKTVLLDRAEKALLIDKELLNQTLIAELPEGRLIRESINDRNMIFLPQLRFAEDHVAENLIRLRAASAPLQDAHRIVAESEKRLGIELAPEQRQAVLTSLSVKVSVITGGPGVGKTLTVKVILDILRHAAGAAGYPAVSLCAPTGRAAKRMTETTGEEARTIHRLLGWRGEEWTYNEDNPLDADTLIADECSMLDVYLADRLLRALKTGTRVIFVGDVDQLPSVGPGMVLADIIESGLIPVTRLTRIYRQAEESQIITAAHEINHGRIPEFPSDVPSDYIFAEVQEPEAVAQLINRLVTEVLPAEYGLKSASDIQVLSPMKNAATGVIELNALLQQSLNPPRPGEPVIERTPHTLRIGDKVMQTSNNYDLNVYNGDIGFIRGIDKQNDRIDVDFDGRHVFYKREQTESLTLAYSLTVHKSQGAEFPCVIIPLTTQHFKMLERNLFYTAVTRGRKLVIVIGQREALELAVKCRNATKRYTGLAWRMNQKSIAQAEERRADNE